MESTQGMAANPESFAARLVRARLEARDLLDLAEGDPARCGVTWERADLDAIAADARAQERHAGTEAPARARDAAASYLAGAGVALLPDHVRFVTSHRQAYARAFRAACTPGADVVIASPCHPLVAEIAAEESLEVSRCLLRFDGAWHLDERSLLKAVRRHTRAIVVGNPSEPSGAILDRNELAFLEEFCARHALALISDETHAGTIGRSWLSALAATRCLVIQIAGLSGICGLAGLGAEWCAVAGPEELSAPTLARLDGQGAEHPQEGSTSPVALLSVPPLLARRERFLCSLRERLVANRALLAARAIGESPWSLLWGHGGRWAVLEVGAAEDEETLCLELLDDGVAAQPGSWFGLPRSGYVVVSLLPSEEIFAQALNRLDRRLRRPLHA